MGNKMMPRVPSYLRWLGEVLFLNTHHGLVELMVLRLAYSFEAAVTHSCGSQEKAADVWYSGEFVIQGN